MSPSWTATLAELTRLRRLVPIGLLSATLVAGQAWFTPELGAIVLACILVVVFLAFGPHGWRRLFGEGHVAVPFLARLGLYVALGLTAVAIFGWALPRALGYEATFLSAPGSVLVQPALFWVGGWGLGRDIELEAKTHALERRTTQLERQAEEAQLLALRAHLDPHFLFNTLNALAEWCRIDPDLAERGILGLATLLRGILAAVREPRWTLTQELALVSELLALHRMRDPSAFDFVIEGDAAIDVPALLLLPLVENAMTHGIARGHRGQVAVSVVHDVLSSKYVVAIESPGHLGEHSVSGHGLGSTRARLDLTFGARAGLTLTERDGRVRAEVVLPA